MAPCLAWPRPCPMPAERRHEPPSNDRDPARRQLGGPPCSGDSLPWLACSGSFLRLLPHRPAWSTKTETRHRLRATTNGKRNSPATATPCPTELPPPSSSWTTL